MFTQSQLNSETEKRGRALFFKRFLKNPAGVADILPSGAPLVNRVLRRMDFSVPRTIAEFGPGEGCLTRKIVERAHKDSRIYLFEVDPELVAFLEEQFAEDPRVAVFQEDCRDLVEVMNRYGIDAFDYVVSGIPFSLMEEEEKRGLVADIYDSLRPESRFITYQVTNELAKYTDRFGERDMEYCLLNMPPLVVTTYHKKMAEAPRVSMEFGCTA